MVFGKNIYLGELTEEGVLGLYNLFGKLKLKLEEELKKMLETEITTDDVGKVSFSHMMNIEKSELYNESKEFATLLKYREQYNLSDAIDFDLNNDTIRRIEGNNGIYLSMRKVDFSESTSVYVEAGCNSINEQRIIKNLIEDNFKTIEREQLLEMVRQNPSDQNLLMLSVETLSHINLDGDVLSIYDQILSSKREKVIIDLLYTVGYEMSEEQLYGRYYLTKFESMMRDNPSEKLQSVLQVIVEKLKSDFTAS